MGEEEGKRTVLASFRKMADILDHLKWKFIVLSLTKWCIVFSSFYLIFEFVCQVCRSKLIMIKKIFLFEITVKRRTNEFYQPSM